MDVSELLFLTVVGIPSLVFLLGPRKQKIVHNQDQKIDKKTKINPNVISKNQNIGLYSYNMAMATEQKAISDANKLLELQNNIKKKEESKVSNVIKSGSLHESSGTILPKNERVVKTNPFITPFV